MSKSTPEQRYDSPVYFLGESFACEGEGEDLLSAGLNGANDFMIVNHLGQHIRVPREERAKLAAYLIVSLTERAEDFAKAVSMGLAGATGAGHLKGPAVPPPATPRPAAAKRGPSAAKGVIARP
jgi:hypothetical protein